MRRPILNNSSAGEAVYDPFLGSGTTLIAAESAGRICLGMELDARYADVCVRRWEAFTGKSAVSAADQRTFGEVTEERAGQNHPPTKADPEE
jgi:DNA modification methylase